MKYKNLLFAYSLEIIFGLITSLLIIIIGPNAIAFLALFAIRPFILEREKISNQDKFWYYSFQLGKYVLFTLSIIIIGFYLINEFFLSTNALNNFRDRMIVLVPFYLLVHGIIGLIAKRNIANE
ncbi:MAG: hypothetical protein M1480_12265 [Bacteroidetes bacterium]|nr:hypothetical protein [Bacteroidota bacterium]